MFDPLKVAHNRNLLLRLTLEHKAENFECIHYTLIDNGSQTPVARYTLQHTETRDTLVLEVHKDKEHNFHIRAYRLVETQPFKPVFASMLGVDSIGFFANRENNTERIVYKRLLYPGEKVNIVKYICDTEDLPANPHEFGYTKDGMGNWYLLMEQSSGRLKRFADQSSRRCWEYENSDYTRLLIEKEETYKKPSAFYIYLGKKIVRKQIHIISRPAPLAALLREQKNLYSSHS